ncbi:AAA family ATPase [Achromobacter sp. ES-001]|uniref:AAA family ATPase n=1 Tax=Achromobacter sp. ES-001 TaxID=2860286 RepID=UPI002107E5CF|nr:AAA family ATPase [Achromobacter sp. ES-001]
MKPEDAIREILAERPSLLTEKIKNGFSLWMDSKNNGRRMRVIRINSTSSPDILETKRAETSRVERKPSLIRATWSLSETLSIIDSEIELIESNSNQPSKKLTNSKAAEEITMSGPSMANGADQVSLNKILYGPPGTGKTYSTAKLAVEICDGDAEMSREELMARYEELRRDNRICFVTFHQSYGYEDFVEGLRPELKDGQVSYRIRPGVFREICDAARLSNLVKPGLSGKPLKDRTIYKMSLGAAGTTEGHTVLQECLEKGYVLLGWGRDIDFSECDTEDAIRQKIAEERPDIKKPDSNVRFSGVFKNDVRVGDLIIVSQGNRSFRAIGEVTGEYEFLEAPVAGTYHQMRPVRWLAVLEANRSVSDIYDRGFVQSALYRLDHAGLKLDVLEGLLNEQHEANGQPFVLIIDEINRANLAKVFGELITLLEPDKREGAVNGLTVKLPYSGDDFRVPANLFVIGTMNTADRSIALLDTALRRRFEFEELQPDYDALPVEAIEGVDLRALLRAMNDRIEYLYDRDHAIGHAYFVPIKTLTDLETVFRRKVIPLLQEYFYEDWSKVCLVLNDTSGGFIASRIAIPKGLQATVDEYDLRPRYTVRPDKFEVDSYLNIYQ